MSLVTSIPSPILRTDDSSASVNLFDSSDGWDYALGGLGFLSAASKDTPIQRKTAPYQKDLTDDGGEPGEHTLQQWWTKAQSSFHGGAFQQYLDTPSPDTAQVRPIRYQSSYGVDPWHAGQVRLLKQTQRAFTVSNAAASMCVVFDGTNHLIFCADGTSLKRYQETVSGTTLSYTPTTISWGGSNTIVSMVSDGRNVYVADSVGIWRVAAGGTSGVQIYSFSGLGATSTILGWAKERLLLGLTGSGGSFCYGLLANPSTGLPVSIAATVGTTNGQAAMSHPNPTFVWSCFTDGPGAFYAGGNAGQNGAIFKFVLDSSGAAPQVSGGISAASFPPGETVQGMTGYVATLLGIVTSAGVRVGQFTSAGDFSYGPLSFMNESAVPPGCAVGAGRWFYVGCTHADGTAGLLRVDTAQQMAMKQFSYVPDQQFATAYDLRAADGSENPVAGAVKCIDNLTSDRRVFLVQGNGVYVEHPTVFVPKGTLTTSRIRFETLDPKVFRFGRFRAEPDVPGVGDAGTVGMSVVENADFGGQLLGTLPVASAQDSDDLPCNISKGVFVTATFTLTRSSGKLNSPVLTGYQVKGLPAQKRQHLISLPLSLFDHERDRAGNPHGGDLSAMQRLFQLEALEGNGDIVVLQHLNLPRADRFNEFVVIEEVNFVQTGMPDDSQGFGGIVIVRLRTV